MNVLVVWMGGATVGLGLWWLLVRVFNPTVSLAETVAALHAPVNARAHRSGFQRFTAAVNERTVWTRLDQDLAVIGRTRDEHLTKRFLNAGLGFVLPIFLVSVSAVAGGQVPLVFGVLGGFVLGVGGWFLADNQLREAAALARRDWRRALTQVVEAMRALVSAGSDIRTAAVLATRAGTSSLFLELSRRIEIAVARQEPLEPVFDRMGREVGVNEFVDLAALMDMVSTGGIDPRQTLEAKAESLRISELSEIRSEVAASTERMTFPLAMMAFAFGAFLVFPALWVIVHVT